MAESSENAAGGLAHEQNGTQVSEVSVNDCANTQQHDYCASIEDTSLPRPVRPLFSLAGSQAPPAHAPSYIDPTYHRQNPRYGQPQNRPIFSVAKPLPHVVRGSRRDVPGLALHRGETELPQTTLQDADPNRASDNAQCLRQRDIGLLPQKQNQQHTRSAYQNFQRSPSDCAVATRSAVHPSPFRNSSYVSQNSIQCHGTPRGEKANPMELFASQRTNSQMARQFSDEGDIAARKLSDVAEILSPDSRCLHKPPSVDNKDTHYDGSNAEVASAYDIDLERGCQRGVQDYTTQSAKEKAYDYETSHYPGTARIKAFEHADDEGLHNWWAPIREKFRDPMAEGLATFVFVIILLSTNLSVKTSGGTAGTYQSENWAGGLGIMIGVYIAGGISGGHLNPALSIILCIFRGFPPRKTLSYITAQCTGAFLAALVSFAIYHNAIYTLDHGTLSIAANKSGSAFLSGLASHTSPISGWLNEFVATGILACAILALGDDQNAPPGAGMHALVVGLVVTVLGMAFGSPTGACLNPARDFGPRLAALCLGYGGHIFEISHAWWLWGAWGSTITGAITGSFCYDLLVFVGSESPVNYLGRKKKKERTKQRISRWMLWWWREDLERRKSGREA